MKIILIGFLALGSISAFASTGNKELLEVEVSTGPGTAVELIKQNMQALEQRLGIVCGYYDGMLENLRCKNSRSYTVPTSHGQKVQATACTATCTIDFE
jgi:hypothetical protein